MAIKQRISLEGSEEVQKQLEDMGKAGEKSLNQIHDAAQQIGGDTFAKFAQAIAAATEAMQSFAAQIEEAGSKAAPALEKVGQAADATSEGLAKVGKDGTKAAEGVTVVGEAAKGTGESLGQIAQSAPPVADHLTALGGAGEKSAEGMVKAGGAAEQASGQVAQSGAAAQDAVRFWSLFALEAVKTGAAVGQTAAALEEATASAGKAVALIGLALAALGFLALVLGKTVSGALSPRIAEQSDAIVKASLEYNKAQAEIAKLNAETAKLAGVFDSSTDSIVRASEGIAKVSSSAAKAAEDVAKAAKSMGSAFSESGLAGARLYENLINLSEATGETIHELQIGQQAFEHLGIGAETFGKVVDNIARQMSLLDIGRALTASANEIEDASNKVDAANKRVLETQKALLESQIKLEQQGGARAPYGAARQLADIDKQLLELTTGRVAAEKSVQDAQRATSDAATAAADAQKARAQAIATSLFTVVEQVDKIIAGQKDIKFDEAVTAERKITAVQIALRGVAEQAEGSSASVVQALVQIIATATDIKDALAIGKQFGIDEAAVNSIRQYGSEASNVADTLGRIPNLFQKIREGGVAIGPETAANFDKVKESTQALEDASLRLSKAWDALFPPADKFEEFKQKQIDLANEQAAEIVRQQRLKAAWVNLGASILEVGTKIGKTVSTMAFWQELGRQFSELAGKAASLVAAFVPTPVANAWIAWMKMLQPAVERLAGTINRVVTTPVAKAWQWIVDKWNAVFGEVEGQAQPGFIERWVTTPVGNAWQWIVDTFNAAIALLGQTISAAPALITAWVTTPVANAWQWIVDTFNAVVGLIAEASESLASFIQTWITTPIANAWQWVVDTFNGAVTGVKTAIDQATAALTAWVTTPIANAWQWVVDAWNAMVAKLFGGKGGGSSSDAAPATQGMAGGGLLGGRGSGTSDSNLAWVSRGEYIVPARVVQQPGVLAFLEALRRSGRLAGHAAGGLIPAYASGGEVSSSQMSGFLSGLPEKLHRVFDIIKSAAQAGMDAQGSINEALKGVAFKVFDDLNKIGWDVYKMAKGIDETLGKAIDVLQSIANDAGKLTSASGKAGGGLLGGRGTGTSDSNLAWLSRGEYIVPAHAVQRPGVLQLLEALRLGGMGGFALGGLAMGPMALPAFAGGGGGGIPRNLGRLELGLPGGGTVVAYTDERAVEALRRASAMSQIRSGGRKPSRYS